MTSDPGKTKSFPWHRWAPWVLLVVGVATYANSLENPFIFDDRLPIEESEYIKRLWPLGAPSQAASAGRPVIMLSLAINYAIGELDPRGYHIWNIAVHILGAMVLFGVVRRTLQGEGLRDRFGRSAGAIAMASSLLWLVHPMQTEVINYVVQRTSSMMSLFYLLTFYCAIRAIDAPRRGGWYVGAAIASILGMMCKESMATAPIALVLYDIIFIPGRFTTILRRRWPLYAGVSLTWIVLAVVMVAGPRAEVVTFDSHVTWLDYAMNQCVVIMHYFKLVLWPYPLILDYGPTLPISWARIAVPGTALVLIVAASIVALFRWPRLGFLGFVVFLILAPSSSIVPLVPEVGAERRMHLPMAPIAVLLVLIGRELLVRWFPREEDEAPQTWAAALAVVLVTGVLAFVSVRRNADYESRVRIWATAAAAAPGNSRAHYNLGVVLVDEGRLEEAEAPFRRAIAIKPNYDEAYYNLGLSLAKRGRLEEAVTNFAAALAIDPENAETRNNMGNALSALRRPEEAIRHFEEAIRIDPNRDGPRNNLGTALASQGLYDDAIVEFRRALEINPDNAEVHGNLAIALLMTGATEGHRHLEESARLDPRSTGRWTAAARALATHPNPAIRDADRAIAYAQKAVDMTGRQDPVALGELAMCFATAGRYDRAIETIDAAIERAEAAGATRLVPQLRTRAETYRRRR